MALAPKSSARTFDVIRSRLEELQHQQRLLKSRRELYGAIPDMAPLERLTAIKAQPQLEQLQYSVFAAPGNELRAALLEQISGLPPTSSGIANTPFSVKIGIISDLFLYKSFEGLADFSLITPENYDQFEDIDLLLLVSTWRGVDGSAWKGVASPNNSKRAALFERILPFYRSLGIPIVFYSKEDPPNYDTFLPFAQQADYIFTSAAEMIPKYEVDCPRATSVDVLPFGINPKHHSPIGSQSGDINRIVPFAGSWFNHKYSERGKWGGDILDAVVASREYELVIFDRNSSLGLPNYRYPNRYASSITPAIDHQTLLDIQRVADFGVNLNSVSDSASMFANRAIELQAQGTVVLSNYNVGLNSIYPQVHTSNGFLDTSAALDAFDEKSIRNIQAEGIRTVFSNDLAIMRIAKILRTVGLSVEVPQPRVLICKHGSDEHLDRNIADQTYQHIAGIIDGIPGDTSRALAGSAEVVVHLDTAYEYDPTHVEDLVNGFRYTDATSVEKAAVPDNSKDGVRHSYINPENVNSLGAEFTGKISATIDPKPGYVTDEVGVRRRNETIEIGPSNKAKTKPPILSVVVPIFNNGRHLVHKCLASLRRSSIYDQMEILLVDDGSTDRQTIKILESLERELDFARVYRFEIGGSGSASRPRNKGLELASCEYITYLDPDNEALNDAYVKLLNAVVVNDVDFAVGNMTRWRGTNSSVNYTKFLRGRLGLESHIGYGGAEALRRMKFMPVSIQAVVARTDWLRATGISQPVGAVGQDSYFFQQMLYYADTFSTVNVAAHTYYAQVENSVVNTINAGFFEKYLPLERARSQWLAEVGLLEDYKATRLEQFFTGWYLRKLQDVPLSQRDRAISVVGQLGRMYGTYEWTSEEAQKFWGMTIRKEQQESIGEEK